MTQEQLPLKIDGVEEYQAKLVNASPQWLKDARQRALSEFAQLGLPTIKDEEWKYISLAELSSKKLQLASAHTLVEAKQFHDYVEQSDINI